MGTSTSSLEVYEEEFKGELVVVKRFRHDERHDPSVEDVSMPYFRLYHSSIF